MVIAGEAYAVAALGEGRVASDHQGDRHSIERFGSAIFGRRAAGLLEAPENFHGKGTG